MKTITVSYARLYNMGNYENERFDATVMLDDGDTVEQAYARAEGIVETEHGRKHGQQQEAEQLEARLNRLAGEYAALQEHVVRIARALPTNSDLGQVVKERLEDSGIPF